MIIMITLAVNNCTFYSVNYTDDGIFFTPLMIIMMKIMVMTTTMVMTMTIVTMKVMMITFAVNNCTFYSVNYTDDGNFRN